MTYCRTKYIGIDPGAGGGIAVIDEKGKISAFKCPKTTDEISALFDVIVGDTAPSEIKLLMERVWARPTNAVRAAFSYGVNYGQWLGIVSSREIEMQTVIPIEWIKWIGCPKSLKRDVRKRWLKEKAKELFPELKKVTLATSDAILICQYAREEYFNEKEHE